MSITIKQNILTKNDCYRAGRTIKPNSMQLHTIGTAQNTAASLASYWDQGGIQACVHYCIDAEQSGLVLQFLPDNRRSWADAGYGNNNSITVELMESDHMRYTGGASYTVTDEARFKADVTRAYNTAVQFFAQKCKEYGWNPQEKMSNGLHRVYSHDEGRRLGLSSSHVDPTHIWNRYGWTMDQFRADVAKAMGGTVPVRPVNDLLYRVRKTWADEKSQLFAGTLEGAKRVADQNPGFSVFDESGKAVYTSAISPSAAPAPVSTSGSASGIPASKEDYIEKTGSICRQLMSETGILASVVTAQCCLETGFGLGSDSTELVKRNNLLGMKADLINSTWKDFTVWDGTSFVKRTPEYHNGKLTYINDSFRVYKDYEQCIRDYEMFLLHVRNDKGYKYSRIRGMADPALVIRAIRIGTGTDAEPEGYCTDPNYETKILKLIRDHDLTRFDDVKKEVIKDMPKYCYTVKDGTKIRTGEYAVKKECEFSPVIKGEKLEILSVVVNRHKNTWYRIKWNGKAGYVYSKNVSFTPVSGPSGMAQKAVANARAIAADPIHGYNNSAGKRGGNPDYACSSFIADCYIRSGADLGVPCEKVYTKDMKKIFTSHGFEDVTGRVNLKTCKGMEPGDILVNPGQHTELYAGGKKMIGARGNANGGAENGRAGDQTGGEIAEMSYQYSKPYFDWKVVLRCKKGSVAKQYRVQCGAFSVKGNCQNMIKQMKAAGFDAVMTTSGGQYIAQAGIFSVKTNADTLAAKIKSKGLPVLVAEI